jgi:hypothetical protein
MIVLGTGVYAVFGSPHGLDDRRIDAFVILYGRLLF